MPKFSRRELEQALEIFNEKRDAASRTGDWSIWASLFTEDADYIEHAYGEFKGRAAIEKWITDVMAPFPHMRFPQSWVVFDEETGTITMEVINLLDHPTQAGHEGFGFPNWTRLTYAGNGLFSREEDIYNPARDGGRVIKAWLAAGGKFASKEKVAIKHS
jgi:ketosteroid isomerase-like protein